MDRKPYMKNREILATIEESKMKGVAAYPILANYLRFHLLQQGHIPNRIAHGRLWLRRPVHDIYDMTMGRFGQFNEMWNEES